MTQTHPLENLYQEELYNIRGKILVLVRKPWSDIQEDERTLLTKILSSVKLSLASVQIIHRAEFDAVDFSAYRPDYIIAFGSSLRSSNKTYERVVQNDVAIVVADELDQLDDVRKRNLWLTLKQLFHS
jgi:hypothetical protein